MDHVFHEMNYFHPVLFDGPVGEQAPPGKLGELEELGKEESHLLQKLKEIIRADPEKSGKMYEKFREILIEERRDDLICIHCPLLNHRGDRDEKHMSGSHSHSPGSDSLKILN